MTNNLKIYSVESVTAAHPDKICDQISDAILDECLKQDPLSRVAVETFGGHGLLVIGGEITTKANFDEKEIAKKVYRNIGYNDGLEIISRLVKQSPDIARGVDSGGAGDQGIMYGYATNESNDYLPFGVGLVHNLSKGLQKLRENNEVIWLKPDGKAQVTIANGKIQSILISAQHDETVTQKEIKEELMDKLLKPLFSTYILPEILINPTGSFLQGGFNADTGLTGRKIMVDTYGGLIPHGGGAFSGKDATKVDRSAAYMCRFVAKNIVANGLADRCFVSVAYAIGRAEPLMIHSVYNKGKNLDKFIKGKFDFRPRAIIERLDLQKPIFLPTASYGHFGRKNFPWEQVVEL